MTTLIKKLSFSAYIFEVAFLFTESFLCAIILFIMNLYKDKITRYTSTLIFNKCNLLNTYILGKI